ncbi:MAG: GTP-binding protein [Thermoplasmata archaeon]|nr:GTP-binding protein [Thermoplasmata archaeon]
MGPTSSDGSESVQSSGLKSKKVKTKVCLVGEKAVGKTSLIRRYVMNMFDDRYITTVGTKVSKKELIVQKPEHGLEAKIDMTIWDIMGEKGFRELLKEAYFYKANGVLAVCDITREKTLADLDDWIDSTMKTAGKIPLLIAVNKTDLEEAVQVGDKEVLQMAKAFNSPIIYTSAKTSDNVEDAFYKLGEMTLDAQLGFLKPEE